MQILDLCGGSGSWSEPYRKAGYHVTVVDPAAAIKDNQQTVFLTVADFLKDTRPFVTQKVHGILMAPPCTEFAGSGARWWKSKDPALLADAVRVVRDCLRCVDIFKPHFWCLENPVGRIASCVPELGKWQATFQPTDYGDEYSKRTCLWGNFTVPEKHPVSRNPDPAIGQKIWYAPPGPERQALRSKTPQGFSEAFYKANP